MPYLFNFCKVNFKKSYRHYATSFKGIHHYIMFISFYEVVIMYFYCMLYFNARCQLGLMVLCSLLNE